MVGMAQGAAVVRMREKSQSRAQPRNSSKEEEWKRHRGSVVSSPTLGLGIFSALRVRAGRSASCITSLPINAHL
jgi:hypothetical protein